VRRAWVQALIISFLLGLGARVAAGQDVRDMSEKRAKTLNGETTCESGVPVIYLNTTLDSITRYWTLVHERIHVEQMNREVSCSAFAYKYLTQEAFRWLVESEAFCRVYAERKKANALGTYTIDAIIDALRNKYYRFLMTIVEMRKRLPC
jgi:Zn-dependent peptidase ImmA (M78 family)